MDNVEDGWARDLEIQDAQNGVAIGPGAKRLTLTNVRVTHSATHSGSAGYARRFALQGTQILLDRCRVTGDGKWPVVTESEATGPLVVLNFTADHGGVGPDQCWRQGCWWMAVNFPAGPRVGRASPLVAALHWIGQRVGSRWAVAWNVSSPFLLVQQPPGALNWCVGCIGTTVTNGGTANGIFDSLGKTVVPGSLYLYQLHDRLGPDAAGNIGY